MSSSIVIVFLVTIAGFLAVRALRRPSATPSYPLQSPLKDSSPTSGDIYAGRK